MEVEAIIYQNKPQQEALATRLTNCIKNNPNIPQDVKDSLDAYTYDIEHPIDNRVALVIERTGYYWFCVEAELTQIEKDSIVTLTSDWFPDPVEE